MKPECYSCAQCCRAASLIWGPAALDNTHTHTEGNSLNRRGSMVWERGSNERQTITQQRNKCESTAITLSEPYVSLQAVARRSSNSLDGLKKGTKQMPVAHMKDSNWFHVVDSFSHCTCKWRKLVSLNVRHKLLPHIQVGSFFNTDNNSLWR